eukprot:m.481147 g.481147  ORF g.481147 m.481147 type:complete len:388 (+) comp22059_c0_seq1:1468-2631(+)
MDYTSETMMGHPIVIDNGSGTLKAGFAGDPYPKCIIPSYVGEPKHLPLMASGMEGSTFIGPKAEEARGLLKIKYPMEHGVVEDWDAMQEVWQYVYTKESQMLGGREDVRREDHPVLLTECPLNPRSNRERAAEIFFETFGVPLFYVSIQAVLALYASGRTTGLVLDSGDGVTHAVPICRGYAIPHSIVRVDVAGRDVTRHLKLLLRKEGHVFRSSSEFEIVRQIKEDACFVSQDVDKEHQHDLGADKDKYTLPDGQQIKIGQAKFKAPEILFKPSDIGEECEGVHEVINYSIRKSDMDLREELFKSIVLSGGSTLYKGFGDRLLKELTQLAPKNIKIRISAPPERKYSTWIGGSILAQLTSFKKSLGIKKQDWDESGVNILQKKLFL